MTSAAPEQRGDARPRRILLTGGPPFVGSHIAERLADERAQDTRVLARGEAALARCEPARVALMGGRQFRQSIQLGDYR